MDTGTCSFRNAFKNGSCSNCPFALMVASFCYIPVNYSTAFLSSLPAPVRRPRTPTHRHHGVHPRRISARAFRIPNRTLRLTGKVHAMRVLLALGIGIVAGAKLQAHRRAAQIERFGEDALE